MAKLTLKTCWLERLKGELSVSRDGSINGELSGELEARTYSNGPHVRIELIAPATGGSRPDSLVVTLLMTSKDALDLSASLCAFAKVER